MDVMMVLPLYPKKNYNFVFHLCIEDRNTLKHQPP